MIASGNLPSVTVNPPQTPSASDTKNVTDYIVSQTVYDPDPSAAEPLGTVTDTIDNADNITRTMTDEAGRTVETIEDYNSDGLSYSHSQTDSDQNITTEYGYLCPCQLGGAGFFGIFQGTPEPRGGAVQPGTQFDGRLIERLARGCGPQVELVARQAAAEAATGVFGQVRRERSAPRRGRPVDRARPADLGAVPLRGDEAQQGQDRFHADLGTQQAKVNSRHDSSSATEKRNP